MHVHRFAVGETVLCVQRLRSEFAWKAPYTVLTCIRSEGPEPQYRIASVRRQEIRVVGEHELCRTPQPSSAFRQSPEQLLDALSCLQPANLNLAQAAAHPSRTQPPLHDVGRSRV
jgi:hypothetical protein